jgi:hypothetical protein
VSQDALEVANLDEWGTIQDLHYKELEAQFSRLYSPKPRKPIHSKLMKRSELPNEAAISPRCPSHISKRNALKALESASKQSKQLEDRLEQEYLALDRRMTELKETVRRESLRVCEIRANLHQLMSEKHRRSTLLAKEESTIKAIRVQNLAAYLSKKSVLQRSRQRTNKSYAAMISSLQMQAENALEQVEAVRGEIEHDKNKMKAIKTLLVKHYAQILKEGKDCRILGLRWVVMQLWKFDVKVGYESFPSFVDRQTAEVVLRLASMEVETEQLQDYLHSQYRGAYLESRDNCGKPLNDIKSRLVKVRSESITMQKTTVKLDRRTKQTQVVTEVVTDTNIDDSHINIKVRGDWQHLKTAEEQVKQLRSQIEEQQTAEILRMAHGYFLDASADIEKDRRQYIAVIAGCDAVDRYMGVVQRAEREEKQLLGKTKTFSFI